MRIFAAKKQKQQNNEDPIISGGPHCRVTLHHCHQRLRATHEALHLLRYGGHPGAQEHEKSLGGATEGERGRAYPEVSARGRRGGASRRVRQGVSFRRVRALDGEKAHHGQQASGLHHRWPLWFLTKGVRRCAREDFALKDDLLSPDGPPHLRRAALPCHDHSEWRTVSS